MVNHIECMHSVLPYGLAFQSRVTRPATIRFAGCYKVVEGCRKAALLVVRKVERMSKRSYVVQPSVSFGKPVKALSASADNPRGCIILTKE